MAQAIQKVRIVLVNCFPVLDDFKIKWLKNRPVLQVVTVAGTVINAAQSCFIDFKRSKVVLGGAGTLAARRCIQIGKAEFQAFRREHATEIPYPPRSINIGILPRTRSSSKNAHPTPRFGNLTQREEIVLALNLAQFCGQVQVRSKSSQSFEETRKTLAGR